MRLAGRRPTIRFPMMRVRPATIARQDSTMAACAPSKAPSDEGSTMTQTIAAHTGCCRITSATTPISAEYRPPIGAAYCLISRR